MIDQEMIDYGKFLLSKYNNVRESDIDWKQVIAEFGRSSVNTGIEKPVIPGLMYINWVVAKQFGLDSTLVVEDKTRKREQVKARHYVFYIAVRVYHYTLQKVADFYQGRHHATVVHGVKTVENQIKLYKQERENLESIINHLTGKEKNNGKEIERSSTEGESGSV